MTKKQQETAEGMTKEMDVEAETAQPYDPWQDKRRIYIPKQSRSENNVLEVGVNDKTYLIPKEQWVEVPMPVWEVVQAMLDARRAYEEYAKKSSGTREYAMS